MSILSTKTGILSIVNIVLACLVIITVGIAARTSDDYRGNWGVNMYSSEVILLITACVSLILHVLMIATYTFMKDGELTVMKTNFFFANQVLLSVLMACSSIALLAFLGGHSGNKYTNSGIAAGVFGIFATISHSATAYFVKTTV